MIIRSNKALKNYKTVETDKQAVIVEEVKTNTKKKNKKTVSAPVEEIPVVEEVRIEDIESLSEWLKEDIDE